MQSLKFSPKAGAGFQCCNEWENQLRSGAFKRAVWSLEQKGKVFISGRSPWNQGSWECCYELMYENQGTDSSPALSGELPRMLQAPKESIHILIKEQAQSQDSRIIFFFLPVTCWNSFQLIQEYTKNLWKTRVEQNHLPGWARGRKMMSFLKAI